MTKQKTIVQKHSANFDTLKRAFASGDVALVECEEIATGEQIAVICTVVFDGTEYQITPFARFFNGNPYELIRPPDPAGGFSPTEAEEDKRMKR